MPEARAKTTVIGPIRQGDLTAPHLPEPDEGSGRRIDIAALTAGILDLKNEWTAPVARRIQAHIHAGGYLRLLLTSRLTQAWWRTHQPGIALHADKRDQRIRTFLEAIDEMHRHRVEIREHLWLPSVGMTAWDGDGGQVWIVPYTVDPKSPSADKLHFGMPTGSPGGRIYGEQFARLWARADKYTSSPGTLAVRRLEYQAGTLLTEAARLAGQYVDLAVVIALSEEFDHFRKACADTWGHVDWRSGGPGMLTAEFGEPDGRSHRVVVGLLGEMGKAAAGTMARGILDRYRSQAIVSIGIAGLLSDDVDLGDVVVASSVLDYMHRARANDRPTQAPEDSVVGHETNSEAKPTDFDLQLGGTVYRTDPRLVQAVRSFRFETDSTYVKWAEDARQRISLTLGTPIADTRSILFADDVHIASGDVLVAATLFGDWIKGADRNLVAVEMEAAGVAAAAFNRPVPVPCFVIRGISDRADKTKGETDRGKKGVDRGVVRKAAMENATTLLVNLLKSGHVPGLLHSNMPALKQ